MSRLPIDSLAFALLQAARIHLAVQTGQSLADGLLGRVEPLARPSVQDLVYGSLRQYGRGDFFLNRLLAHPLADQEVRALLLVALAAAIFRKFLNITFTSWLDYLLGAVVGAAKGLLVCAIGLAILQRLVPKSPFLMKSALAVHISALSDFARSLLPPFL